MRRVWRQYAWSIATHNLTKASVLSLICTVVLAQLVFVSAVIDNFRAITVRNWPRHALEVLQTIDTPTLLMLALGLASFWWASRQFLTVAESSGKPRLAL